MAKRRGKPKGKPTQASKPPAELTDFELERVSGGGSRAVAPGTGVGDTLDSSGGITDVFLKLQINDPTMDPDTAKKLSDLTKEIRNDALNPRRR